MTKKVDALVKFLSKEIGILQESYTHYLGPHKGKIIDKEVIRQIKNYKEVIKILEKT